MELIIYIAIMAMIFVAAIGFTWNLIGTETRVDVSAEIIYSGQLALNRITQEVRFADDVVLNESALGVNPGMLVLSSENYKIVIDTYEKDSVRKLRMKRGNETAVDLTSNGVDITGFIISNRTRGSEPKNVGFELALNAVNKSISFKTAASVRKF